MRARHGCKHQNSFPLINLKEGDKGKISCISGGEGIRKKMTNLGIVQGMEVEILSGSGSGPRVLRVGGTKIMLGHGLLHKIFINY